MKIKELIPARKFNVGTNQQICINHCADIYLKNNEQVTFVNENSSEYASQKKIGGIMRPPQ